MTKEEKRLYKKEYRKRNKKLIAAKRKKHHEKNKARFNQQSRDYYYKNIEKISKQNKEYRKNNKDKIKQNREKNKEKLQAYFKEYYRSTRGKYNDAKKQAKYRKLSWDISFEEYTQIIQNPCFYHKTHQLPETGSGLDRIDNNKGYAVDNVLPCCSNCNYGRGNRYTTEEWKIMVEALENFKLGKLK